MKIMLDATSLARTITGIENYTKNLLDHLIEINHESNELIVLFRNNIPDYLQGDHRFKSLVCPFESQLLCEQIWIPFVKLKYKPDVIHFPAFPPSFFIQSNIYFTVHDVTMWKYANTTSIKNKLYMKPLTTLGIKKAEKVLTVSESSKNGLIEVFPFIKNKIENTGISISQNYKPVSDKNKIKKIKDKYNLPNNFFLTVGSLEPRKNLLFLIKAFLKFKTSHNTDFKLVITGRSAWGANEIKKLIENSDVKESIIFTGYVPTEDLVYLYSLATYFVFPSIYEGFGLPVLESMACGTPVIISHTSSLPEVAGDAAIYFNPTDEASLLEALALAVSSDELRNELKIKSLNRAKVFSWNQVAKRIYKEYLKEN